MGEIKHQHRLPQRRRAEMVDLAACVIAIDGPRLIVDGGDLAPPSSTFQERSMKKVSGTPVLTDVIDIQIGEDAVAGLRPGSNGPMRPSCYERAGGKWRFLVIRDQLVGMRAELVNGLARGELDACRLPVVARIEAAIDALDRSPRRMVVIAPPG
jgi:hypothetical protein